MDDISGATGGLRRDPCKKRDRSGVVSVTFILPPSDKDV